MLKASPQGSLRSLVSFAALAALLAFSPSVSAQDGRSLWTDIQALALGEHDGPETRPTEFRTLHLDAPGLAAWLNSAPVEEEPGRFTTGMRIALPLPDGDFATYEIIESSVMAPGLQSRYPSIRTYLGRDVDVPSATLRLSVTPQGFHAFSHRPKGTLYIDPFRQHDREHVISYWRHDFPQLDQARFPGDHVEEHDHISHQIDDLIAARDAAGEARFEHGQTLRIYRMAIAANRFYAGFHSTGGANVEQTLAAIAVALNRLNGIYEREIAVRMILVEQNDQIIYTTAETDPYSNAPSGTLLSQNQTNLDAVVGTANYDIGHVFVTGGGGIATLRGVCVSTWKGRGSSGLSSPVNDPFVVDIVAHEIGHQFGANHTFNGALGSCGGNRNSTTAYEPGSGSTIMAYSGLCSTDNVQVSADDYFHNQSLTEMIAFLTNGAGNNCGEQVATGNPIPEPVVQDGIQIPIQTPFRLPGGAEFAGDPAALTYVWEGMDLGPEGPPPGRPGWDNTAPFFRTFRTTNNPTRFFPRADRLVLGISSLGEGLPSSTRLLRFRLTVRSNAPGAGAVKDRQILVPVAGGAGPFVVTSQSGPGTVWAGGEQQVITWDVANTNTATFGGENVDILLSLTRHQQYVAGTAIVLAESVPNNGSAIITVPDGFDATQARVFVQASDGFFFAVNSSDITVAAVASEGGPRPTEATLSAVFPNPVGVAASRATVNLQVEDAQTVRLAVFDALGRQVAVVHDGPLPAGVNHQFDIRSYDFAAGTYFVRAIGERFSMVRPMTVVR
jgi:hypothetical protein